jgi:thioredoxin 1
MLIIGLQWLASQFAKVGLLPDFIAKRLGLVNGKAVEVVKKDKTDDTNCCGSGGGCKSIKENNDNIDFKSVTVEHITDDETWEALVSSFTAPSSKLLIVKFTAEWCNPCKAIQPTYLKLATKYHKEGTFVTLDIDGDGCDKISSRYKVAMLPTFICFSKCNNGDDEMKEIGRMTGGKNEDGLVKWIEEMVSKM